MRKLQEYFSGENWKFDLFGVGFGLVFGGLMVIIEFSRH